MTKRGTTGTFHPVSVEGHTGRAFVPFPLPPDPPLRYDAPRRRKLLEQAIHALGGLDAITTLLPEPEIFLYTYVRREAVLSSQIEGTQLTLSDLLLFELDEAPGAPFDDVREVSNYVRALEHGMRRLKEGLPLCNRLLREMHAILLDSGRGSRRQPGQFRTRQNWLNGETVADAEFVPPPPEHVEACMAALEHFLNARDDEAQPYETLIKAALAHVQFETIHPFLDGNGRLGRMLVSFVLHAEGLLRYPLLYLSLFLRRNRRRYFHLLTRARTEGAWEDWLDFFLEGVRDTAGNAVHTANRLMNLFRDDEARIASADAGRQAATLLVMLREMQKRPLVTASGMQQGTGLSQPTINKAFAALSRMGIVREITGKKRGRVYAYRQYMSLLDEGARMKQDDGS